MAEELPSCPACDRQLDRIDRVSIERYILDRGVFRDVDCTEGIAGESDMCCGHCGAKLPQELRAYFYRRWYMTAQFNTERR